MRGAIFTRNLRYSEKIPPLASKPFSIVDTGPMVRYVRENRGYALRVTPIPKRWSFATADKHPKIASCKEDLARLDLIYDIAFDFRKIPFSREIVRFFGFIASIPETEKMDAATPSQLQIVDNLPDRYGKGAGGKGNSHVFVRVNSASSRSGPVRSFGAIRSGCPFVALSSLPISTISPTI